MGGETKRPGGKEALRILQRMFLSDRSPFLHTSFTSLALSSMRHYHPVCCKYSMFAVLYLLPGFVCPDLVGANIFRIGLWEIVDFVRIYDRNLLSWF